MTVNDPLVAFFGPATPTLGEVAGLSPADSGRVLRGGLPLLVQALADTDRTPEGRVAIDQAYAAIPNFPSVEAALNAPGGAPELLQAGEVLSANVLSEPLESLAARLGLADSAGATRLLQLALPLLLSLLAGRGLRPGELVGTTPAAGTGTAPGAAGLTAAGLIETLRGRLSGQSGEALGRAAGFTPSTAGRAAAAALPVLLAALARKGQDGAGAADLLNRSRDLEGLAAGPLPTDPAEITRLEGQGRPLVTHLFGSADAVTGRLGSAVGGSGASTGKLLALLAPVVLGLLGREARASGTDAAGLSRVLGDLPGLLPSLIPPGMPSLSALLAPPVVAAATPQVRAAPVPRPAPAPTTRTTTGTTVTPTRRRGGFPWWLIPLLLLLGLGGYWLTGQNGREPTSTSAPAVTPGESLLVTNPTSDATLPAEPFVMSGTAAPDVTLTVSDEGDEVATAAADDAGNWEAQIPAPTPGEHTYTVEGPGGTRSEFKVNVVEETGAATISDDATDSPATGPTTPAAAFAITAPAADAELLAGGFTLSGTGEPGQTVQILEDGTSLGTVMVADDSRWSLDVPSPAEGPHTYAVRDEAGAELSSLPVTVAAADPAASAATCDGPYSLSISGGQTVSEPFRFGGSGEGEGYLVTVRRGERVVGTKRILLDRTCGWSYQSRPGPGEVSYDVRPLDNPNADPLSTVNLTVAD
ncbi:DUF937 domain-containing protein [Deinococcus sp. MIMF12]|uniref:DUF937 domain-containing protein n=1 Tax=Deinococcus rhizophilus TaxID=3049544 RepID=A0ABT7JJA9_9DEIO|nr:DUF937 domain-containing protein [Deinococcus rhizophilus]MDL2344538.1 DUF937 domain-containing protein [Deinococcus rhizophilus]